MSWFIIHGMYKQKLLLIGLCFIYSFCSQCFALTEEESRHFLLRTGEDLTPETMAILSNKNREEAYDWLLRGHSKASIEEFQPAWLESYNEYYESFLQYPEKKESRTFRVELAKKAAKLEKALADENFGEKKLLLDPDKTQTFDIDVHKIVDITGHFLNFMWLERMIKTSSPFTETMTLFWHSHFTSSFNKVNRPSLMLRQNALFRKSSLGNFGKLLEDITLDGAMLIYLDGSENVKGRPNLNYARELLELFTIGEGNYTEADVREVARALTGLRLKNESGYFDPSFHDDSEKVILSARGNFNYKHVLSMLLRNDNTSRMIVRKLWKQFISLSPDEKVITKWARSFKDSSYDTGKLVRIILTSDEFYSEKNRNTLIKSPVEFVTQNFRIFRYYPENYMRLVHQTRVMGQILFRPPDVRGWIGGTQWITLSTWLIRQRYIKNLLLSKEGMMDKEPNAIDSSPFSNRITDSTLSKWKLSFKEDWKAQATYLYTGKKRTFTDNLNDRELLADLLTSPEFSLK